MSSIYDSLSLGLLKAEIRETNGKPLAEVSTLPFYPIRSGPSLRALTSRQYFVVAS